MNQDKSGTPPGDETFAVARGAPVLTFAQAAAAVLEEARRTWTTPGTLAQWRRSIDVHAAPFHYKALWEITTDDIVGALAPLWKAKPALAVKVRKHWERVLNYRPIPAAPTTGHLNPASWTPGLKARLQGSVRPTRSPPPFQDLPPMMERLRAGRGLSRVALELSVLVCVEIDAICAMRRSDLRLTPAGWSLGFSDDPPGSGQSRRGSRPISTRAIGLLSPLLSMGGAADDPDALIFMTLSRRGALTARGVTELSVRLFGARADRLSRPALEAAFCAWAEHRRRTTLGPSDGPFCRRTVQAALASVDSSLSYGREGWVAPSEISLLFEAWSTFLSDG